jgi:hypothetical protein
MRQPWVVGITMPCRLAALNTYQKELCRERISIAACAGSYIWVGSHSLPGPAFPEPELVLNPLPKFCSGLAARIS